MQTASVGFTQSAHKAAKQFSGRLYLFSADIVSELGQRHNNPFLLWHITRSAAEVLNNVVALVLQVLHENLFLCRCVFA